MSDRKPAVNIHEQPYQRRSRKMLALSSKPALSQKQAVDVNSELRARVLSSVAMQRNVHHAALLYWTMRHPHTCVKVSLAWHGAEFKGQVPAGLLESCHMPSSQYNSEGVPAPANKLAMLFPTA